MGDSITFKQGDTIVDLPHGAELNVTEVTDDGIYIDGGDLGDYHPKSQARAFINSGLWEYKG